MSVDLFLRNTAARLPDKKAIFFGDTEITYGQFDQEVDNLAQGFIDLGLGYQQRVSLLLANSPDFIRAYFAITRAGGTVIPLNPLFKGEEIKYILNDAEVVFLITTQAFLPLVESVWGQIPALKKIIVIGGESDEDVISWDDLISIPSAPVKVAINPEDIAACLYTSGTTGKPKGALLSHSNLMFDAAAVVNHVEMNPKDNHLCVLPLFHSYAQMAAMLCPIYSGGSITVMAQFRPDHVLKEIGKHKVTLFCGVPAMYAAILQNSGNTNEIDLSSLRLCFSGGAPMPLEIMHLFEDEYGIIVIEGNGPTETSPVSYANPMSLRKPGSVGTPLEGVKVKIVNENDQELPPEEIGEICVQGPNVMKGYLNQPEATAEAIKDGWFHTGDLGKKDADGYIYIVDRKKDMLIVSGLNVYPREVEECLYQHPKVAEAAVIGIHDSLRGEVPKAFIVLKPGETAVPKEFSVFCRERLANFKCPRQVQLLESIPKTATGKIDKKQLREAESMGLYK
ncbi:long-chain-fatty-acid--CoA ligase [Candidatus Formimonas warabiya]|uniref:AMP-binding protein n=1 Tax=Formimonas warabiya TaxID=1761012 RepID=A0A3G1KN71_FORW1|nr:long-chain fatty acid--CoA ligase [Candidatus Formimonas warabiya]ATW23909.1 AMP-binding protein [Candidatus Formimonas warabiya]